MDRKLPRGFIFLLASLTAISPLAIDAYLPAMPAMSDSFDTPIGYIEMTLSIYLAGFSLGQLVGGPMSDRYGRKVVINTGLLFYIFFSYLIIQAGSVEQLWLYRFFQALGGGFAVVNTAAIVRDNFHGKESAKVFSFVSMVMMMAPMLAPTLGTLILHYFTWEYIFGFLGVYAALVLGWIQLIPETSPKTKGKNVFKDYWEILSTKRALFLAFTSAFGMSGMFVFITKSSFVYMEYFGVEKYLFTLFFGMNVAMVILFSRLNIYLLQRFDPRQMLRFGVGVQIFSALFLILLSFEGNVYFIVPFLMLFVGALGFIFANVISLVLELFPHISGTANAVVGVMGFAVSSMMGFAASLLPETEIYPVFLIMLCAPLISITFFYLSELKK